MNFNVLIFTKPTSLLNSVVHISLNSLYKKTTRTQVFSCLWEVIYIYKGYRLCKYSAYCWSKRISLSHWDLWWKRNV